MAKQFFQADVAESSSGSIWTGPLCFVETYAEAEFRTLLELQQDWGDEYMTDEFLEAFGRTRDEDGNEVEADADPEFPGVDAWEAGRYWTDGCGGDVVMSMLTVPPAEALGQLGKIEVGNLSDGDIEEILADRAVAELKVRAAC